MLPDGLILASASPRRQQLFSLLGVPFSSLRADVEENRGHGEKPEEMVCRLSRTKAEALAEDYSERLIVAADTIVVLDGQVLGKPADADEATAMLRRLRGREHLVLSGLTALGLSTGQQATELAQTTVWMRPYSDEEISCYVASADPLDKAGAYAIQHQEFNPVACIQGCYASVMGLPLCHLARALSRLGLTLPVDVPRVCQGFTGHRCFIAKGILRATI
ncbi:MAG: septum formation protein Maf [Anaerolineales bacterium]|nr:MAG: septum formation protein Maf [Anaerolineales bacterium]